MLRGQGGGQLLGAPPPGEVWPVRRPAPPGRKAGDAAHRAVLLRGVWGFVRPPPPLARPQSTSNSCISTVLFHKNHKKSVIIHDTHCCHKKASRTSEARHPEGLKGPLEIRPLYSPCRPGAAIKDARRGLEGPQIASSKQTVAIC